METTGNHLIRTLDVNKRILEIAEQATRRYDRLGYEIPFATPDLEVFAQLIIRECAQLVNDNDYQDSVVVNRILFEHFGIEL